MAHWSSVSGAAASGCARDLPVPAQTDVLAGWTAGAAWALVCGVVVQVLGARGVTDVPVPDVEDGKRSPG